MSDAPKYNRDQMIAKISKLLNLAGDPNANEHVAAQAAAKAQELMQQWAIDEDALGAVSGQPVDPFTSQEVPYVGQRYLPWEGSLLMAVADAMMTHAFKSDTRRVYTFAGRGRDVEMAVYMFCQLRTTLIGLSRRRLSEHAADMKQRFGKSIYNVSGARALAGCHPTVYRQRWLDSWLIGAEQGVATKLKEQQQTTVAANANPNALMVIENRREEAEDWAVEQFKLTKSRKTKARKTFDSAASQGYKDGKAIQLRKGLTTDAKDTKQLS